MVKETPDYQWVCQRCKADNAPHTRTCKGCGFSAFFTAADLAQIQGKMQPVGYTLADGVTFAIVFSSFFGWLALFHDSPLVMFLGFKLFMFGGVLGAVLLCCLLKAAYDAIAALLRD